MPKVKVPRKSTFVDMTAMTDVAFLLLTFFMLATKFKPEEPVIVDPPSSTSVVVAPEKEYLLITVEEKGKVFYGIGNEKERETLLREMGDKYGLQFTKKETEEFVQLPLVGVPMNELKTFLSMDAEKRKTFKQSGIPCDSAKNELKDWVYQTQRISNKLKVIIKGDRDLKYSGYNEVIKTLKPFQFLTYNFITALEKGEK